MNALEILKLSLYRVLIILGIFLNYNCTNKFDRETLVHIKSSNIILSEAIQHEQSDFLSTYDLKSNNNEFSHAIVQIDNTTNKLITKINNNTFQRNDLLDYILFCDSLISIYSDNSLIFSELNDFSSNSDLLLNKILLIQYITQSSIISSYPKSNFIFHKIKPVQVSDMNTVNFGQNYETDIFLAVFDTINPYYVTINDSVLPLRKENVNVSPTPFFRTKAIKMGINVINADMHVYCPITKKFETYPFKIQYLVKQ